MTDSHQDSNSSHIGPSVIELELTDEIRNKQLVTQFTSSFGSKSVILKLNGKYENKIIEFYPIDIGKGEWTNTLDSFIETLKEREVNEEDRIALRQLLNQNSEKIANHFAEQQLARMTAGQKAKMVRVEKLKNGPPVELSIKDALRKHEGIIRVKGMINGLGVVEKMYKAAGLRCGECDSINVKFDYTNSRPRFADEIPRIHVSEMRCECQSELDEPPFCHESWDDPVNASKIILTDTEAYSELESLNVILLDDYTRNVQTGEQVIVTGSLQKITVRGKTLPYLFVGLNPITDINPFEYVNKKESVELSNDDKNAIKEFLAKNKGKELEALVKLVAPSIVGYEDVKKGLLMSFMNTGKDPVHRKRRLQTCYIGEPGLAKSAIQEYAIRLEGGNSTFASAADASTKSLIGVVDNEEKILRIGPIPRAHGSICSIDEIGRH
jgi:DNA replicative helicase MCM subunit Mcm2 (Cdc46/Mcm family)